MVFLEYINFEHNTVAAELVRQTYDTPPLAFVHSYGCQQNVNDGERIKGVLVDIGYGLCDKPEDADLILFNTCAVREHAEQRVFGNVGALKGLKEKKPGLIIGLSRGLGDVYKRQSSACAAAWPTRSMLWKSCARATPMWIWCSAWTASTPCRS